MSDELERLRADLEVFERHGLIAEASFLKGKIARLEAEAADPWREAKQRIAEFKLFTDEAGEFRPVKDYVNHLTAENDRLAARVAELEAAAIRVDFENGVATLNPDALVLDPARVLATAAIIYGKKGLPISESMCRKDSSFAKPYRLKGGDK